MPIPWKNCGKAGDILSVQTWDASSWPPAGTSGPLAGTATFDQGTGALTKLLVVLFLGTKWVFESVGDPGATVASGFVTLPSSLPMALVAPPLPLSAGPLSRTDTFSSTVPPITVLSHANLGQNLTSVTASLGLTYNGMSGFPIAPTAGTYGAMLQLLTQQSAGVFCIDLELTDTPFIGIASAAIPTLSEWAQIGMVILLVVGGLLALRHRRA